jgi:hypothetical protein
LKQVDHWQVTLKEHGLDDEHRDKVHALVENRNY